MRAHTLIHPTLEGILVWACAMFQYEIHASLCTWGPSSVLYCFMMNKSDWAWHYFNEVHISWCQLFSHTSQKFYKCFWLKRLKKTKKQTNKKKVQGPHVQRLSWISSWNMAYAQTKMPSNVQKFSDVSMCAHAWIQAHFVCTSQSTWNWAHMSEYPNPTCPRPYLNMHIIFKWALHLRFLSLRDQKMKKKVSKTEKRKT